MAILKCKMCGGELNIEADSTICECEYCGTKQTVPTADSEKKLTLFARANRLRFGCEFDKAAGIYESIVSEFSEEAEAYWGLVLCKYGIEYVDDPATGKKVPTCHRSSFDSVMDDGDFEQVLENADPIARKVYREEAKQIEELRRGILEVSGKEKPYDIFISYKETDNGDRTLDSVIAQDIYDALTAKGYRVFFSRISLEEKLGTEYEPYIFAALNSAKLMLAVGTDYEYFNAVWVKNEWSRYLKLMAKDKAKHLIPVYKNIDAYDMPKEFAKLAAQDMGKVGALQDLLRGVEKLLGKKAIEAPASVSNVAQQVSVNGLGVQNYIERIHGFLADRDWEKADAYCEKVLDMEPKNSSAYVGKCLCSLRIAGLAELERTLFHWKNSTKKKAKGNDTRFRILSGDCDGDIAAIIADCNHIDFLEALELVNDLPMELECSYEQYQSILAGDATVELIEVRLSEDDLRYDCKEGTGRINRKLLDALKTNRFYGRCVTAPGNAEADTLTGMIQRAEAAIIHEDAIARTAAEKKHRAELQRQERLKKQLPELRAKYKPFRSMIAAGKKHSVAITPDGVVATEGNRSNLIIYGYVNVDGWADVVAVAAGDEATAAVTADGAVLLNGLNLQVDEWLQGFAAVSLGRAHIVGLKADGTVVAAGDDKYGQCRVSDLRDVAEIAVSDVHTVALKKDGTVAAVGDNGYGQCNVTGWQNIVSVAACNNRTVGLKADGTVVSTNASPNDFGKTEIEGWENILFLSAASRHVVGLKADGTVVASGIDCSGECGVSSWRDIIAVSTSESHTLGITANGQVMTTAFTLWQDSTGRLDKINQGITARSDRHKCDVTSWRLFTDTETFEPLAERYARERTEGKKNTESVRLSIKPYRTMLACASFGTFCVTDTGTVKYTGIRELDCGSWREVVAVASTSSGDCHYALKADGTVVAEGPDAQRANVSVWKDLVEIAAGSSHVVGLKSDGTVVAAGDNKYGQCNVTDWRDIIMVAAWSDYTIGLQADGVVVKATNQGTKPLGGQWQHIVAVSEGPGLTEHGTAVSSKRVATFKNMVAVCAIAGGGVVGLKADGTLVSEGGERSITGAISTWKDVVAIAAGYKHMVGLKSDGTVLAAGDNKYGQCNVTDWKLFENTVAPQSYAEKAYYGLLEEKERLEKELPSLGILAFGRKLEIKNRLAVINNRLPHAEKLAQRYKAGVR